MLGARATLPAVVLAALLTLLAAATAQARPGSSVGVRSLIPPPGQAVLGVVVLDEHGSTAPPRLAVAPAHGFPPLTTVAIAEQRVRAPRGRYAIYVAVARRATGSATTAASRPATIPAALVRAPHGATLTVAALGAARNVLSAFPSGVRALMRRHPVRGGVLDARYSSDDPQEATLEEANLIDGAIARALGLPCPGCGTLRAVLAPPPAASPALSGAGSLSFFDSTEVRFTLSFDLDVAAFAVEVPGGRRIVDSMAPLGFSCAIGSRTAPEDTFLCQGSLPAGVSAQGNLQLSPSPQAGMGALLLASRTAGGALLAAGRLGGP